MLAVEHNYIDTYLHTYLHLLSHIKLSCNVFLLENNKIKLSGYYGKILEWME